MESLHNVTSPRGNSETPPTLRSVYFGKERYERMAKVLEATARKHCEEWDIRVERIPEHSLEYPWQDQGTAAALMGNAHKSFAWSQIVEDAEEGERLLLIDADCYIRRPLEEMWEEEFDVVLTETGKAWAFCSGVMFVRVNERSKRFFRAITEETWKMVKDGGYHAKWRQKYAGIHQAAIGAILENGGSEGVDIKKVPCSEWDALHWNSGARVMHLIPRLRKILFDGARLSKSDWRIPIEEWRRWDVEVNGTRYGSRWDEILSRVPRGGTVVEVGVWKGITSQKLLESSRVGKVILVDPWREAEPGTSWWNSGSKMPKFPQRSFDKAYKKVVDLCRVHKKGTILRMESLEAASRVEDHSVDLVFIDGNHSREACEADIRAWLPKVKEGGWIGGHDLDGKNLPGVRQAVEAVFGSEWGTGGDLTWWRGI